MPLSITQREYAYRLFDQKRRASLISHKRMHSSQQFSFHFDFPQRIGYFCPLTSPDKSQISYSWHHFSAIVWVVSHRKLWLLLTLRINGTCCQVLQFWANAQRCSVIQLPASVFVETPPILTWKCQKIKTTYSSRLSAAGPNFPRDS